MIPGGPEMYNYTMKKTNSNYFIFVMLCSPVARSCVCLLVGVGGGGGESVAGTWGTTLCWNKLGQIYWP